MSKHRITRGITVRGLPGARHWGGRFALVSFLALALVLMGLSRAPGGATSSVHRAATGVLAPVAYVLSQPLKAVQSARGWVAETLSLRSENNTLRLKLAYASQAQTAMHALQAENQALRGLIRVAPAGKVSFVAAHIVGGTDRGFSNTALINAGMEDGVQREQAVMATEGLVGRITEASMGSARVLIITDLNSRIPVVGEHSRERSIAEGNDSPLLTLGYVEGGTAMQVGERMLTSGDGGVFPPGIPVGVITAIEGGKVYVRPLVDWTRLETVSAVRYEP